MRPPPPPSPASLLLSFSFVLGVVGVVQVLGDAADDEHLASRRELLADGAEQQPAHALIRDVHFPRELRLEHVLEGFFFVTHHALHA